MRETWQLCGGLGTGGRAVVWWSGAMIWWSGDWQLHVCVCGVAGRLSDLGVMCLVVWGLHVCSDLVSGGLGTKW